MAAAGFENGRRDLSPDDADECRPQNDQGKRDIESEDGYERCCRDHPQHRMFQGPRTDAVRGLHHDGRDGRFDAVEQSRHKRYMPECDIQPRQADQDEHRGQKEQHAGDHAAPGLVQQPADIGCQLLRLRSRQNHAEIKCVQEALFRYPAPALDQLLMHDRDLTGRPAEADKPHFQPKPKSLAEADRRGGLCRHLSIFVRHVMIPAQPSAHIPCLRPEVRPCGAR